MATAEPLEDSGGRRNPGFDAEKPSPARLYDFYLGGKDYYKPDRAAAERLYDTVPELPNTAKVNRAFHQRAGAWMAAQGIAQFLDIGCGLPTNDNTHSVVRKFQPDAKVVYVDHDPHVVAHARALLTNNNPRTQVAVGDIRDPKALLHAVRAAGVIDFAAPVGLLATAVLHFVSPEANPPGIVAALTAALAPGSFVALSHITGDAIDDAKVSAFNQIYAGAAEQLYFRTRSEFEALFSAADLRMVAPGAEAESGVCFLADWAPADLPTMPDPAWYHGTAPKSREAASQLGYAGVGEVVAAASVCGPAAGPSSTPAVPRSPASPSGT